MIISISLDDLVYVIQGRSDAGYKIIDKANLLKAFETELNNYAESNATELGLSELQYFFDKITDEVVINHDVIEVEDLPFN